MVQSRCINHSLKKQKSEETLVLLKKVCFVHFGHISSSLTNV